MNRTRIVIPVVLLVLCSLSAHSQAELPEKGREGGLRENVFGLGLSAGSVSGVGLSFRHHLPGSFSYQLTGGVIKVDDRTSYAIGVEAQYDLKRTTSVRFFAIGGLGYYYAGGVNGNEIAGPARLGVGVGGEIPVVAGFHITGELLFTYFSDGTVLPLPQVGMHYYFY